MGKQAVLGILVSGRGSNLQAIIDTIQRKELDITIGHVITDQPQVFALERAKKAGIPHSLIHQKKFDSKQAFENAIVEKLKEHKVEYVALAGFMRILSPHFLKAFAQKIVNIHPSLLPAFPGLHAQKQALDAGVKIAGCTVHLVNEAMDSGPIIAQACVPVYDDDSEESLSQRILDQEHRIYPQAIGWLVTGKITIEQNKVRVINEQPKTRGMV